MPKTPDYILSVATNDNQWQSIGSSGDNAVVAKPLLICNDCLVTASIFKNGDGFFQLSNNKNFPQTFKVTLGWLGVWQQEYTVTAPANGKFSGIRDVP